MALELDDVVTMWHRRVGTDRWRQAIADALDQLLADGAKTGRHLILNLHPWLIGHPHRIGYLEEVLADVRKRDGVWIANASQIAAHARTQLTCDGDQSFGWRRSPMMAAIAAPTSEQPPIMSPRCIERNAERVAGAVESSRNGEHGRPGLAGALGRGRHRRDQRVTPDAAIAASMPGQPAEDDIARAVGAILRIV